jgi:hypothetical protein|tara:strand:- start:119 stop:601 length:483 start_codon:yes stop_codon:yes gene_type:complete
MKVKEQKDPRIFNNKLNFIIVIILLIFYLLILPSKADIEDEIYQPNITENFTGEEIKKIKKKYNIIFENLITCVYRHNDLNRIFRFGLTSKKKFFYREPIDLNKKTTLITGEKLIVKKNKGNYSLNIRDNNLQYFLLINFEKKKSKLNLNKKFIGEVDCK